MAELARLDENGIADLSVSTPAMQAVFRREITEREDLARFAVPAKLRKGQPALHKDLVEKSCCVGPSITFCWAGFRRNGFWIWTGWPHGTGMGARKLASHLGADDEEETAIHAELLAAMTDLVPEDPAALLPSWRFMLELLSILLPPEAVFCTADDRMAGALLILRSVTLCLRSCFHPSKRGSRFLCTGMRMATDRPEGA